MLLLINHYLYYNNTIFNISGLNLKYNKLNNS